MDTATTRCAPADGRNDGAEPAWVALPLRTKLRVLIGDAYHALGFAVWEIRLAAGSHR